MAADPLFRSAGLFAEDFDLEDGVADAAAAGDPGIEELDGQPAAEPQPDPAAEALEQVRSEAYADGFRAGLAQLALDRAETTREMLALIAERMRDAREAAKAHGETLANAVARLVLGTLGALFPLLSARHGPAEVVALARSVLPTLVGETRVTIRVSPHVLPAVQAEIDRLDPETLENLRLLPAEAMAPGDLRFNWQDGAIVRDGAAVWTQVAQVLAAQGLIDPPSAGGKPTAAVPEATGTPCNGGHHA